MLNFKKGGLFSRKDEPEPDVQQESGAQPEQKALLGLGRPAHTQQAGQEE